MPYSAEISRANPTCFLFLVDQSRSMLKPLAGAGGKTKAEGVADALNHLLSTLVRRCVWGNSILDRLHVGVLGYGVRVGPALGGALADRDLVPISAVGCHPLRVEQRSETLPDGSTQSIRFPLWLEPVGGGKTPMGETLERAGTLLAGFLVEHPDCFPPVVLNISDGMPTDRNPSADADRLRQLSSSDGHVLLFNLHLSGTAGSCVAFPDSDAGLADPYARLLFRLSSLLPPPLWPAAREAGVTVSAGTRGFVYNGDLGAVLRALDIGTRRPGLGA
jgi:hypothetical protein